MKIFLSVVATLLALLGAAWLFLPDSMLGRWGVHTDPISVFMGRRYGATLLGYATIIWLARASGPSPARTAIVCGGSLVAAALTILSLVGVLSHTIGAGAWPTVAVEALLTVGFLYFWLSASGQRHPNAASAGGRG